MTGSLTQIAAGRAEVWGLNGSQPYRFDSSTKKFGKISDKISGPLAQIAVGGGSLLQPDQVWGINASGYIYQYDFGSKAFVYVAGGVQCKFCVFVSFSQIAVGEGDVDFTGCHPYEVWAVGGPFGASYPYRYNYCTGSFDLIPIGSGSTIPFTHLAVGRSQVWGLDANAQIWQYRSYASGFIQITSGGYYGTLQQIAVGVNDVWGLDGNGTVYRYEPISATFLTEPNVGNLLTQITAGGDGVWAIVTSGNIPGLVTDYDPNWPSDATFSIIPSFPDPPPATQIAVGSGAGVWVVNSSNQVYAWVRP
jgi:hypothetical protein